MQVIYSIGVKFNGGGLGNTAYYSAKAIHQQGWLKKIITSAFDPSDIDVRKISSLSSNPFLKKLYNQSNRTVFRHNLFDLWATTHVEQCDVFWGWSHFSLFSLLRAKRYGAISFIDRQSAEITMQNNILRNEYRKLGHKVEPINKWVMKKVLAEDRQADFIMTPSNFVRESYLERGYPEDKILLNPLGIDLDKFKPGHKKEIFRVIFLGRISVRKGVPYLLRVWNKLNLEDAELIFVGGLDSDMKQILDVELLKNKKKNIILAGFSACPEVELASSTVFVFPSMEDGFATVVPQAMACELPVVITENTGAKDCVRHGVDGFIIPSGDEDALADKILYFYRNRNETVAMGKNARERALMYRWDAYQERLTSILNLIKDKQ